MIDIRLQKILNEVFPKNKEYSINSLTPTVLDDGRKVVISFLAVLDDYMIQNFIFDKNSKVDIKISTYLERNKYNIGKDLAMRFDFYYPTGHPMLETVIYGDLKDKQKSFVKALRQVDEFIFWVVDKDTQVKKVMQVNWDSNKSKDTLDEICPSKSEELNIMNNLMVENKEAMKELAK